MAAFRDIAHPDNHAQISGYLTRSTRFSAAVQEFLEKKCALQKQYAENLQALLHGSRKQVSELLEKKKYSQESNQLFELWEQFLMVNESEHTLFQSLAENVGRKVVSVLADEIERHKHEIKEIGKDKSQIEATVHKMEQDLEKHITTRNEALKPLAVSHGGLFRKRSASAVKPSTDDASYVNARSAHNDYVIQLTETNGERRRYFENDLLDTLDKMQEQQAALEQATKEAIAATAAQTAVLFEPMAALQDKVRQFAQQCDLTLDVPEFVKTIYTQPYAPPKDVPFSTPADRTLDPMWSDNSLITAGAEIALGNMMQRLNEEVATLVKSITANQSNIAGVEKLRASYEGTAKYGDAKDVMPELLALRRELRAQHMRLRGCHAVLALLAGASVTDAGRSQQQHTFVARKFSKVKICMQCHKRITMLQQCQRCTTCRLRVHDKCRDHVSSACGVAAHPLPPADEQVVEPGEECEYADLWGDDDDDTEPSPATPASATSVTSPPARSTSGTTAAALQPAARAPPPRPAAPSTASAVGPAGKAIALYDFKASNGEELSVSTGQTVALDEAVDGEPWWRARAGTAKGLVPSSYLQRVSPKTLHLVRTEHAYAGVEDGQLTFPPDVVIEVLEGDDGGWSRGLYDGEEGLFPTSYAVRLGSA